MGLNHFSTEQVACLSICFAIIILSIITFHLNRKHLSLCLLFVGSIGLGMFVAHLDPFLQLWDEQFHALVAKNVLDTPLHPMLYNHPMLDFNFKDWSSNSTWLHKQPLFLWQIALSVKLFGVNAFAVRIPSIILHAIATLIIFRIGKITSNERIGFYGALFFAVSFYQLELISGNYSTGHNDTSFLFYITASFWAWFEYQNSQKKYWLVLIGLFSGCAILVKWLVGLLIYASWVISIVVKHKKDAFKIKLYFPLFYSFLVTCITFIPWQIYILIKFPKEANYEFQYNTSHFFQVIEGHHGDIWFHFDAIADLYGAGDAVPYALFIGLILFIWKIKNWTYRSVVISSIFITYGFYTIAATKMISFCVIVSPFVFLGLSGGIDTALQFTSKKIKFKWLQFIFINTTIMMTAYLVLNIDKIEQRHTFQGKNKSWRKVNLQQMDLINHLKEELDKGKYVIFNVGTRIHGNIPVMFYTDYIAYEKIPTKHQIKQIQSQHYKVVVVNKGDLPNYITGNQTIKTIDFNPLFYR